MSGVWTWSKTMDEVDNDGAANGITWYNRSLEKGRAGFDVSHRWVSTVTYELPIGKGRRFRQLVAERIKRITIKPFMDMSTMIEERLLQCCVHVGTQRGDAEAAHQCAPFCAVQAWPALAATKLAELARAESIAPPPAAATVEV